MQNALKPKMWICGKVFHATGMQSVSDSILLALYNIRRLVVICVPFTKDLPFITYRSP